MIGLLQTLFKVENIKDYMTKITEEQSKELIEHCNKNNIAPHICAWYENERDRYDDYRLHCGYTKEQVDDLPDQIFCKFSNGEIVKLVY
jgi:hypothetical protein